MLKKSKISAFVSVLELLLSVLVETSPVIASLDLSFKFLCARKLCIYYQEIFSMLINIYVCMYTTKKESNIEVVFKSK